jgi:hypothetical protein
MQQPDPKLHFRISMVKSGIRILAGIAFITGAPIIAGAFLIVAEIFGIVEELA